MISVLASMWNNLGKGVAWSVPIWIVFIILHNAGVNVTQFVLGYFILGYFIPPGLILAITILCLKGMFGEEGGFGYRLFLLFFAGLINFVYVSVIGLI